MWWWTGCAERCELELDGRCVRVEVVDSADSASGAGDPFGGPGDPPRGDDDDGSSGPPVDLQLTAPAVSGAIDCPAGAALTVHNRGDAAVLVESVRADADGVEVEAPLPVRVLPGDEETLQLTLTVDAPLSGPLDLVVSGDGWSEAASLPAQFDPATFTESFAFVPGSVDWVLALDVGDGAYAESAPWYDGLTAIADAMSAANVDWRVLVVDRGDGCGYWHEESAPFDVVAEALDDWWIAGLLFYSVEADQELVALSVTAVERSVEGSCNVTFRRGDAELFLTVLTDEPESSGVG
ncbi:MAG: hypothetical protein ABMA64_41125, partial [Myxococcota bacterium]